jgi:hypothetical protein
MKEPFATSWARSCLVLDFGVILFLTCMSPYVRANPNPPLRTDYPDYSAVLQYYPNGEHLREPTSRELRRFPTLWPTLPPEQNASTWYLKAAMLKTGMNNIPPPGTTASGEAYAGDLAALNEWITVNRPALDALLEGNKLDYCRYPFFMSRKGGIDAFAAGNNLGGIRQLSILCSDAGVTEELNGNLDAAVDWHLANIRMGKHVSHGTVIQNLVGQGVVAVGRAGLDSLVANATLSDESLRKIIAGCRAAESSIPEWIDTAKCENECMWELAGSAGLSGTAQYYLLGGKRELDELLKDAGKPLYILLASPEAQEVIHGRTTQEEGLLNQFYFNHAPWYAVMGNMDSALRATQVRAAIALYQREAGKLPDKLDELCPKLLPAVPLDPFSGKPLLYEKTQDGWKIWSVGLDLKDDGGMSNDTPSWQDDPDFVFKSNVETNLDRRMRINRAPTTP